MTIRLDLGCGMHKLPGHIGVDKLKLPGVDVVLDFENAGFGIHGMMNDGRIMTDASQWPWKDEEVGEVYCSHCLEHLTPKARINFFNEIQRILVLGGKATIITPHWQSGRAYGDLTHVWPPVTEFFYLYLDRHWRLENAIHLDATVDPCGFDCDLSATLSVDHNVDNLTAVLMKGNFNS